MNVKHFNSENDAKLSFILIISDIPNILFVEFNSSSQVIKFSTTKFVGVNNESSLINHIAEIPLQFDTPLNEMLKDINLFPQKLNNLYGREIGLAIFNYMPYTLWKEVVSGLM
jgi:hypothetical protein